MNGSDVDGSALIRLRRAFLDGTAGAKDYWRSESDLASYDATFAQRIGWKWDFVLLDLRARAWRPEPGAILDWGCGTGIAARAFLDHIGTNGVTSLHFLDRSRLAVDFAMRRAAERFPDLDIAAGPGPAEPAVVLLSHVLTELTPEQTEALIERLRSARTILWVEPGTYEASLALIAIRERLRREFHPVAPCPHSAACGILAPGNEPHWCHHFATPPPEVFTDPFWGRFAELAGIDLRSVPLSYLVLDRRPPPPLPPESIRLLGRPRVHKADARIFSCASDGARDRIVSRREHPDLWQAARKDRFPSLFARPPNAG